MRWREKKENPKDKQKNDDARRLILYIYVHKSLVLYYIYVDTQVSPGGWVLVNPTPIVPTVNNLTITNLIASTAYKIKVVDAGNSSACKPIEILITTLAN